MGVRKVHNQSKFLMVKHALNLIYFTLPEVYKIVSIKKIIIFIISLLLVEDLNCRN